MARFSPLVAVLLLSASLARAGDINITLKPAENPLPGAGCYINEIIDARECTADIGFGLTGMFNSRNRAFLVPDFRTGVMDYLGTLLPPDSAKAPVTLKFLLFRVSEKSGFSGEFGMFEVKVNFYAPGDSGLTYLYTTEDFIKEPGMDVTSSHERHIRQGLAKCLEDFIRWRGQVQAFQAAADTGTVEDAAQVPAAAVPDTLAKKVSRKNKGDGRSIWFIPATLGLNSRGAGLGYLSFSDRSVWCPAFTQMVAMRSVDYTTGIHQYTGLFLDYFPSFGAIKKLSGDRAGLLLDAGIPVSFETIERADGTTSNPKFVIGLHLNQSLMTLPKKAGLSVSIGTYEMIRFNSEAFPWDIGIAARVGVQY
ncbi:MAG: hypothetical protein Q7W05_00320 [Deltaproteobacteria bacterium]|nr:hypothetical protein [Deltaproteobacteria bacterium]